MILSLSKPDKMQDTKTPEEIAFMHNFSKRRLNFL